MKKVLKICLVTVIIGVVVAFIGLIIYWNTPYYKMKMAYRTLSEGKCLSYSQNEKLEKYLHKGYEDAKVLLLINAFLNNREDEFDIIMSEEIVSDVNYGRMFRDARQYLSQEQSGRYADFYYDLREHIYHLEELDPASIRIPEEETYYRGKLPCSGMKVVYFNICALGMPDSVSVDRDVTGGAYHTTYNWHVNGVQIYCAWAKDGYVTGTSDLRDNLYVNNNKTDSQNSSSESSHHNSNHSSSAGYDSYDEGYEDIFYDDDYDWDRYWSDDDYASGVDDAMDELDW